MKFIWHLAVALIFILFIISPISAIVDDSYTKSLLHFDGDYIDESGKIWTPVNVTIDTAEFTFGVGAVRFINTSYSGMTTPLTTDFSFGSGDFTVDFWYYEDATTDYGMIFTTNKTGSYSPLSIFDENGVIRVYASTANSGWDILNGFSLGPASPSNWAHYALVRNGSTFTGYKNGVFQGTASSSATLSSLVGTASIGERHADGFLNGKVDEVRVSKGIARYLTGFSYPTSQYGHSWSFGAYGTYHWICPDDITMVFVSLVGGGSSGHGGWVSIGTEQAGYGGKAGELLNVSGVSVIPGTDYTIIVGNGGARDAAGDTNNVLAQPGTYSAAFGYMADGGAAVYGKGLAGNGDNGEAGYLDVVNKAEDGEDVTGYTGGIGPYGRGSAGGGGAANSTSNEVGYGGAGMKGGVWIVMQDSSIGNRPEFSASETNITAGEAVQFYDESIINDNLNLTYLWEFGDGYTSATAGDVTHVYGWNGAFTVNLTLISDTGTPTETKAEYIIVSTDNEATGFTVSPRYVDIYVKTWLGAPIQEATVVVTPMSTSSGSWDWLVDMLGLPTGDFNPNTTVMTQTTDIQGRTTFFVLPTAKYDVNITKAGYTFQDGSLVPSDTQYTFRADIIGTELFTHGYNELEVITFFTNGSEINTTHGRIYTVYNDSLAQTMSVDIFVNQSASIGNLTTETTVANYIHGTGNFSYTFVLEGTRDHSYLVRMRSNGTVFGLVYRDYGVVFPPGPISLGIPEDLLVYVGMLGLIFIALCFTRTLPGPAAFITMFFAWIFYLMRWWRDLAPEWVVIAALIFFTVVAVFFNIMIRSKETYGGG